MSDWKRQIEQLLWDAYHLPFGIARMRMNEEAVRLADLHRDRDLAFSARKYLVAAAVFAGASERAMVAFAYLDAECKRDPAKFPESEIVRLNKLIVHSVFRFPQIPLTTIRRVFCEFEERWERLAYSPRQIHLHRSSLAQHLGEDPFVHIERQKLAPRGKYCDCVACEYSGWVTAYASAGRDAEALEAATPLLSGETKCAEEPHRTYGSLVLPALRLGRLVDAEQFSRTGVRLIGPVGFLETAGEHLVYCALVGQRTRALRLLERHLSEALGTATLASRFEFMSSAAVLVRLLRTKQRKTIKLALDPRVPIVTTERGVPLDELSAYFDADAAAIAARFDARNGTSRYARRLEARRTLEAFTSTNDDT